MSTRRPIRIGIDGSNLRLGGGITHLVELLKAAEPAAHDIEQIVVWGGRILQEHFRSAPWLEFAYQPLLDRPLPWRAYWQHFRLTALAKRHCDLLFVPGGSYLGAFRPLVTMSRNLLPFQPEEHRRYGRWSWMFAKLLLLRHMQTYTMRRAAGVIFLNDYARRTVLEITRTLPGVERVIAHGVDPGFMRDPAPQRPLSDYSADRPFRFLYVSTIDVYKHQWHVAEAIALLRSRGLPVALDLIGSAYAPALVRLRRTLEQLGKDGVPVRYRGAVPYAELPGHYHGADGFVFASSCENMPNTLLEAMAAGLPIACSRRGPMPEVLGDAGIYFDPEQPESIATTLAELLMSPDRRAALAAAAHSRAKTRSWGVCASETLAFLREIHDRAPRSRG